MKARILWIEGKRADSPSFIPNLRKKDYQVEVVTTGSEALERVYELDPDIAIINVATMRTNGKRICKGLREKMASMPILMIANADTNGLSDSDANLVLTLPFTSRKLVNRITQLIPQSSDSILHCGPIRLDLKKKQVRCQGRESSLTPRLILILKTLMQHPGEVLERKQLFQEIWKTDYTVDTRTLDVHISWLRQAIEEDPRNPKFLKTIRRLGYRLDV